MGAHAETWKAYVLSLMADGQLDKAGVISYDFSEVEYARVGKDDPEKPWEISKQELAGLAALFTKPEDAFANGIIVGGEKFLAIKADSRSLYGKKGKEGIVISRSVSAVFVAHHGEQILTPNAATKVEGMVDYINNPSGQ